MGAAITGWGAALPERIVTNDELGKRLGVDPGWIRERTAIDTRHIAGRHETTASLASEAGAAALASASLDPDAVDTIIVATSSADYQLPGTASLVQHALGCNNAGAFDLGAACTGFLYALAQARALVESGDADTVLVIGSETLSRITDHSDAKSCVLFGDGAGAVVVQKSAASRIGPFLFRSDGAFLDALYVRADERLIRMEGREVYRHAVEAMAGVLSELLGRARVRPGDIDLVVAHQANGRILDAVAERLRLDRGTFAVNIGAVGNTSAASIPLALVDAVDRGRLKDGDQVALTAFGAGFTWGAGLLGWGVSDSLRPAQPKIPALVGTVGHLLEVF